MRRKKAWSTPSPVYLILKWQSLDHELVEGLLHIEFNFWEVMLHKEQGFKDQSIEIFDGFELVFNKHLLEPYCDVHWSDLHVLKLWVHPFVSAGIGFVDGR